MKIFVPATIAEWQRASRNGMIYLSGLVCGFGALVTFLFLFLVGSSLNEFIGAAIFLGGLWVSWVVTAFVLERRRLHYPPLLRGSKTLS